MTIDSSSFVSAQDSKDQKPQLPPAEIANVSDVASGPEAAGFIDETTAPFQFRCADSAWPISPPSRTGVLTVSVRSLLAFADRELVFNYELIRVEDGAVIGREHTNIKIDRDGNSASIPVADGTPDEPGVYEIRCQVLESHDRIWNRLTRSPNPVAATKTPWIVIKPTVQSTAAVEDVATAENRQLENRRLHWRDKANIDPIHPDDWQRPAWMPVGATKLVPNVKRVGDTLSIGPWHGAGSATPATDSTHQLLNGDAYIGHLNQLSAHQLYQLSMTISDMDYHTRPSNIRIEFSASPTFDTITRTLTLRCSRKKDVSSPTVSSVSVHDLLHYPRSESEFVRISNEGSEGAIRIHSVTLSEPTTDATTVSEAGAITEATGRRVKLWVRSANWLEHLVPDYDQTWTEGGYCESTRQMYRVWKATSRLATHARWCGYDEVSLPVGFHDPNAAADPIQSGSASQTTADRFVTTYAASAVAGWTATGDVLVVTRQRGESIPDRGVIHGYGRQPAADVIDGEPFSAPTIQVLDFLLRNTADQLSIHASELPQTFNRSFRHTLAHYRRAPVSLRSATSLTPSDTNYVAVFVGAPETQNRPATDGSLAITVVNIAPWSSNVKLQFSDVQITDCAIVAVDETNAVLEQTGTPDSRLLTIGPSSVANLRVRSGNGSIALIGWQATMQGGAATLERLKEQVGEVVGKIGTLAIPEDYDQLRNGGFEIEGQVGIVGWMHTQFPASAVEVDSEEAIAGSRSIRLTCDDQSAGRIWLVSEPIAVPRSGRLAVSLAVRANKKSPLVKTAAIAVAKPGVDVSSPPESMLHRMRVSLEGNRLGKPIRYSKEIDIPCDGMWQPRRIVLEIDGVFPDETDALRLTIDSLSTGKLWIDDVHLHDRFPTEQERISLQDNAFLAIQGLQRGNLKPAAGLLNNDWSRYLLAKTVHAKPVPGPSQTPNLSPNLNVETQVASAADPKPVPVAPTTDDDDAPRATVAERLREWLPKPIRF